MRLNLKNQRKTKHFLVSFVCASVLIGLIAHFLVIVRAISPSLPYKYYLLVNHFPVKRGAYVSFDKVHPENNKMLGFTKQVLGLPGDLIEYRPQNIWINQELIIHDFSPISSQGKRLSPINTQIIPKGFVFVAGTHPKSFDSRYREFGLVPIASLKGRAFALW